MSEYDPTSAAVPIEAKAKKKPGPRISDRDFVQALVLYKSYGDTAEAIGMTVGSVQSRAGKLRKLGVNLPKPDRVSSAGKKVTDVAGLTALIS